MQTNHCYLTDQGNQVALREEIGAENLDEAIELGSIVFEWYRHRTTSQLAGIEIWHGTLRLFASRPSRSS